MNFISWIFILMVSFFGAGCASAQPMKSVDGSGDIFTPKKRVVKTVNMLDYAVPDQRVTDALQFHLEGYMECLGGECKANGEPAYYLGGFAKTIWSTPNVQGDQRYINSKSIGGHPNEYFVVKDEFDDDGNPIKIAYIEWETMDWATNQMARGYHDAKTGYPTFEWGRSNVVPGAWNIQTPSSGRDIFCGAKPDATYPLDDTGYTVYFFDLSKDLAAVNNAMGSMGPVEPKWLDIAKVFGVKPEVMIIAGQWGYNGFPLGPEPWKWTYRELYFYLKGIGFVSWRWQEHIGGDLKADFQTLKQSNLTTVVWEETAIRLLDLCEKVPTQ